MFLLYHSILHLSIGKIKFLKKYFHVCRIIRILSYDTYIDYKNCEKQMKNLKIYCFFRQNVILYVMYDSICKLILFIKE